MSELRHKLAQQEAMLHAGKVELVQATTRSTYLETLLVA